MQFKNRILSLALSLSLLLLALSGCADLDSYIPTPPSSAPISQNTQTNSSDFRITFLDVGQADSILVECDGHSMLVDGGNVEDSDLIYSVLKRKGIEQLDYVICTHAHEDHVGGLTGALNYATASVALSPVTSYDSKAFTNFANIVAKQGLELQRPQPEDTFSLGSATIIVLGPVKDYDDTNNTSIVVKVLFGETSYLLTGDMERKAELDLIESGADLSADVLKIGHHGSNTSSSYAFLNEVMPSYAVISCGEGNSYGHPHEEVLSRLRDADTVLYRTDLQGDIILTSDGTNIYFETGRNAQVETNPTESPAAVMEYIGNKNSLKLHLPSCGSLPAEHNQVIFSSVEAAVKEGYSLCGTCMQ